jgi:hypothetical protein
VPWERVVAEDRPYVEWLVGDAGPGMSEELYDHLVVLLMPGWRSAAMRTGKSYRHGEAA